MAKNATKYATVHGWDGQGKTLTEAKADAICKIALAVQAFNEQVLWLCGQSTCLEPTVVRKCRDALNEVHTRYALVDPKMLIGYGRVQENIWRDRYQWAMKCLAAYNVRADRTLPPRRRGASST